MIPARPGRHFTVSIDYARAPRPPRHLRGRAHRDLPRARQPQCGRQPISPRPGHIFPLIANDGGVLDALGPYRGRDRSLPPGRAADGRRHLRTDERRRLGDEGRAGVALRRRAQPQARHHRRPDPLSSGAREADRARLSFTAVRALSARCRAMPIARPSIRSITSPLSMARSAMVAMCWRVSTSRTSSRTCSRAVWLTRKRSARARTHQGRRPRRAGVSARRRGRCAAEPARQGRYVQRRIGRAAGSGARSAWARRSCAISASPRSSC